MSQETLTPFFIQTPKPKSTATILLLIDDAAGVYIPRNFYENFDLPSWGLKSDDYRDLSHPDNEFYWETWEDALRNAKHVDDEGKTWTLEQDGSLFAIREDHVCVWDQDGEQGYDE